MECSAYLDVETTGLSPNYGKLTVIGIHFDHDHQNEVVQLVGSEITAPRLIDLIKEVSMLYTYNGTRFDLPFIRAKLGVELTDYCKHRDLMYDCWQKNMYGGLKRVERELGIERKITDIDGFQAVKLWYDYEYGGSEYALLSLLEYNKEDVTNLKTLRKKLNI